MNALIAMALIISQPDGPPSVPSGPPPVPGFVYELPRKAEPQDDGKPYVLFSGIEAYTAGPYRTVRDDAYDAGIYLVITSARGKRYFRMFGGGDILAEMRFRESEVSRSAIPFAQRRLFVLRRGELRHRVDDDRDDPRFADMLQGLEPYETATKTQMTFRRVTGYIAPSPRSAMPNKWNVPGHLDGVQGWSSKLYKTRGINASVFLARQDPFDSVSAVTWSRSYPDVTFVDVLRGPSGDVFEVRIAVKDGGQWDRFVAYSNHAASPTGYVRPTSKDCRSCHHGVERPGISAYGGAAIPGADSVFSEPFDLLEAGHVVQGGNGTQL